MIMKRMIPILFLFATAMCFAGDFIKDAQSALLEVRYRRTEVYDTLRRDSLFFMDEMMLRIGQDMSLFCSVKRFQSDSLSRVNSDAYWSLMKFEIEKKNPNVFATLGGHKRSYLYKYYSGNKIVEEDYFDMTPWRSSEEWEKPVWEIADETKTILGYECTKAETDFRGRKWIAWFTPDIPLQEGPWKLCGLPGLILEANDADNDYIFEACGLWQTGVGDVGYCVTRKADDYINVGRKKFLENWWHYKHSDFGTKIRAAFGVGPVSSNKERVVNYDKEETDYSHDL